MERFEVPSAVESADADSTSALIALTLTAPPPALSLTMAPPEAINASVELCTMFIANDPAISFSPAPAPETAIAAIVCAPTR